MGNLTNVAINVNGQTKTVKMETGCTFTNNGGTYAAQNGVLKFKKAGSNVWTDAKQVKMTNYQWQVFQNVANNDGQVGTYTKKDIQKAQEFYKKGTFVNDMSKNLPNGYKIDKTELSTPKKSVQVDVAYKGTKAGTLKFQIAEDLKTAPVSKPQKTTPTTKPANTHSVSLKDKSAKVSKLIGYYENSDENGDIYGYTATKGNVTSYYDEKRRLCGSSEELPNGTVKYTDKNGKCLYYMKEKTVRAPKGRDNGEDHRYIYDNKGKLKYIIKFNGNDPRVAGGMLYDLPAEEYNNGKLVKKTTASILTMSNELDMFTVDEHRIGMWSIE